MEATGRTWVKLLDGATRARALRSWDGLEPDLYSPESHEKQVGTVWTAPAKDEASFAEWEIRAMRGRSILQVGVTVLDETRRSFFWGDASPGSAVYLFFDRYGYAAIKSGSSELVRLPQGAIEFTPRVRIRVNLSKSETDPSSSRVSFLWDGQELGSATIPVASDSGVQGAAWGGRCVDGHACRLSAFAQDGYGDGWMCSLCNHRGQGRRAFCAECYFDLCGACAASEARAGEIGDLTRERSARRAADAEAKAAGIAEAIEKQDEDRRRRAHGEEQHGLVHIEGHGAYCPACEAEKVHSLVPEGAETAMSFPRKK